MTQQERFEAWATSKGINITDNGFGGYDSQWTEGALAGWEAAQAQAASTKDFSNLTNQAHGYSDVVSLGGMDPRNYAAANGVRQAAVKPVAYLTETEQGPMAWTPDMYGEACTYCDDGEFPVPLYASPPTQAAVEPVGYFYLDYGGYKQVGDLISFPGCVKLYTSPPDSPKAMRLALEALKFIKQWGECALAVEKRDAAIAALEKELK